ncbi:radical SAM protein [Thermoflexus sp.]|uniref:radical SAM protein n=2 Tax=Thermoflexus sp. TaxID=1969742 RepID=UPI0025F8C9D1|nr:radical SAM protein [Thermoflexus sp.]MCS7351261.1 radical SAM protein [Thermoflexus sp.]MDW8180715.1 radical SAM protein [Anaerolineae bacterium]
MMRLETAEGWITLNLQRGALSLHLYGQDVLAYDRAGRLWSAALGEITYRRGLDNRVQAIQATPEGTRRRWLTREEIRRLEDELASRLRTLGGLLAGGAFRWITPPPDERTWQEALSVLDRASRMDFEALEADAQRFAEVYAPIGILPPDQYLSLVVQATLGCPFNTCTFCGFYRAVPFRVRSPEDFEAHLRAIRAFFGHGLWMRRTIFLGSANALAIPMPRLISLLERLRRIFPVRTDREGEGFAGIYAFLDGFTGLKKTIGDYEQLRALGLRRVYIGLESGHEPLLRFLQKPATAEQMMETVGRLKAAGLPVGVIVMIGIGGDRFAEGHVRDTLAVLQTMPLGRGDLVYLSDFVEIPGTPYRARAEALGIRPLSPIERRAQAEALRAGLRHSDGEGPRVAPYAIEAFLY